MKIVRQKQKGVRRKKNGERVKEKGDRTNRVGLGVLMVVLRWIAQISDLG
jgi:hypothetical protein